MKESGWIWTKNCDGARFVEGLELQRGHRLEDEASPRIPTYWHPAEGEIRRVVYNSEIEALQALATYHEDKGQRYLARAGRVRQRLWRKEGGEKC